MQLLSFCHVGVKCERIILKIGPKINLPSEPLSSGFGNLKKVMYIWGMRILIIFVLVAILSSCKKQTAEPDCYKCVFGSIIIGGVTYQPEPEIHCEQRSENYKKYHLNGWQYPTVCKQIK